MKDFVEQLNTAGYAIIRGFLSPAETAQISSEVDRFYAAQGLKHHATYRDRNLLFEILDDPKAGRRVGYLGLSDDGPIMVGQTQEEELRHAGLVFKSQ